MPVGAAATRQLGGTVAAAEETAEQYEKNAWKLDREVGAHEVGIWCLEEGDVGKTQKELDAQTSCERQTMKWHGEKRGAREACRCRVFGTSEFHVAAKAGWKQYLFTKSS